eukprot:CCRYP_013982-RA/>CCRYP_013982-RA protein AED:0.02 eAED:0.02 QI:315/1/1/1/0.5/0.33/3/177/565
MDDPNTKNSPSNRPVQQTDSPQQPISPVSTTTTTAGSMPPLPAHDSSLHVQTPHDATSNQIHPIDPLSNLAASSINTLEIHAKLAMSATSHETSMSDILGESSTSPNIDIETGGFMKQGTMQPLPDLSHMGQKALRPSPTGEELERRQLEHVKGLLLQNSQGSDGDDKGAEGEESSSDNTAPQDVKNARHSLKVDHEGEIDDTSNFVTTLQPRQDVQRAQKRPQQEQQPEKKLTISTSTISLALSTTLSTPMNTPLTPEMSTQAPSESAEHSSSLKRQRSLSLQETENILMGADGDSSDSDEERVAKPSVKKIRLDGEEEVMLDPKSEILKRGTDDVPSVEMDAQSNANEERFDTMSDAILSTEKELKKNEVVEVEEQKEDLEVEEKKEDLEVNASRVAVWSARQHLGARGPDHRWRAHQMAEDYVSLASSITLPPTYLGPFGYSPTTGQYPIEQVTALGYLTSPLRRPTVIEKWSPYEIVTFEAAITLHGKLFHKIQKWVKSKSTKEIVEFYYIWKKTSHYQRWKNQYEEEIQSCSSEDEASGKGRGGTSGIRLPTSPVRRGRR